METQLGWRNERSDSASYIASEWIAPEENQKEPGSYRLYIADGEKGLRFFLLKKSSYIFQVGSYETRERPRFGNYSIIWLYR